MKYKVWYETRLAVRDSLWKEVSKCRVIITDFGANGSVRTFSGLENIFLLTMRKKNELRVDMEDWQGEKASAKYSSFSIDTENVGYQLYLGSFAGGTAGEDHYVDLTLGSLGLNVKANG